MSSATGSPRAPVPDSDPSSSDEGREGKPRREPVVETGPEWLRAEIRRRIAAKPPTPGGRHARRSSKGAAQWTPGDGSPTTGSIPQGLVTGRAADAIEGRRFAPQGLEGTVLWSRSGSSPSSRDRSPGELFRKPDEAASSPVTSPSGSGSGHGLDPVPKDPPKRVRVVLSERRRSVKPVRTIREVQEDTAVGELLRSNLIGSQLSIALRFATIAGLVLGLLPLVFALVPDLARVEVLGLRLPWLILGLLIYPFLFVLAWWHTRTVERVEQSFAEYVQD